MGPDWEKQITTVSRGELEGKRIDAEFSLNEQGVVLSKNSVRLGDIAFLKAGGTPYRHEKSYWEDGNIPWVKSGELKDNLNIQEIEECITEKGLKSSSAKLFAKGTLLIAMYGATAGEVGILGREATTNQAVCSVVPKNSQILVRYIFWALFLLRRKIKQDASGGAQPNISKEYLENLQIPLPPLEIQQQIVDLMDHAIARKQELKTKADEMLAGVDEWLIGELGIEKLEEKKDRKVFSVNVNEMKDGRTDAEYYQPKYKLLEMASSMSKFPFHSLGEFLDKIHYGASVSNAYVEIGIPFLRIKDLHENEFELEEVVYLPENMRQELGNAFVQEGDFLISRSGSVGIVATIPKELEGFAFGSFMIKFRLADDAGINQRFLSYWLNSKFQRLFTEREKIGAIQGNITIETIRNFKVPFPPLSEQERITKHIETIISEARVMRAEAVRVYEEARVEVEKRILN